MIISVTDPHAKGENDEYLLSLLQKGNRRAFTEIYNRYWKKLFTVAANKLHNLADAEELVQDIFLDIWNRRETLSITSSLSAYLAVAVKYKVIDRMAKKAQQIRYRNYAAQHLSVAASPIEDLLNFEELQVRLQKATADLPAKCRLVFELSRNHDFSQKQIAAELGIAEKTVESHLGKALRTLRISLGSLFASLIILNCF